jgi:hypothetical protein
MQRAHGWDKTQPLAALLQLTASGSHLFDALDDSHRQSLMHRPSRTV